MGGSSIRLDPTPAGATSGAHRLIMAPSGGRRVAGIRSWPDVLMRLAGAAEDYIRREMRANIELMVSIYALNKPNIARPAIMCAMNYKITNHLRMTI